MGASTGAADRAERPALNQRLRPPRVSAVDAYLSIGSSDYQQLAERLMPFDRASVASAVGGLLSVPDYQPQTIRLEMLLHLAVAHCQGDDQPSMADLRMWLEEDLGALPLSSLEDPLEDVFVTNVIGPGGNYRVFEGTWEINDRYLQFLLNCLQAGDLSCAPILLASVVALLRVSDEIAARADVTRWEGSPEETPSRSFLQDNPTVEDLQTRVTLSGADLDRLDVTLEQLRPFLLPDSAASALSDEDLGHTTLERHPLLPTGDGLVCLLPTAISPASRRYVLETLDAEGELDAFSEALHGMQAALLFHEELPHMSLPKAEAMHTLPNWRVAFPDAHASLCLIDRDKVAAVVLVHEDLRERSQLGFGGFTTAALGNLDGERFLPNLPEGMSYALVLVVGGGLGGGRQIEITASSLPDCPIADVALPDLETLSSCEDFDLLRVWKLLIDVNALRQSGLVVRTQVGLLELYAFAEQCNFRLVPIDAQFPGLNVLHVSSFVIRTRERERRLRDQHGALLNIPGVHMPVERLHRHMYFERLAARPIFVAPALLSEGSPAGVVEHAALSVWATSTTTSAEVGQLMIMIWDALLSSLDELLPHLPLEEWARPIQIRLVFEDPDGWDAWINGNSGDDDRILATKLDEPRRIVAISLPPSFGSLLSKPANEGEKALLLAAATGICQLTTDSDPDDARSRAQELVETVLGDPNKRQVHVFRDVMVEGLPLPGRPRPRLIPNEDVAQIRRGLAWKVLPKQGERTLSSQEESNKFLKDVVDTLWGEIEPRLAELDARSLVALALENAEALERDRARWRRTARALITTEEDAAAVAAEHESRRSAASLSARVLIEMAHPTCKRQGGRPVSWAEYDWLTARVETLVSAAYASDAINRGFAVPQVTIFPSGEFGVDESFLHEVTKPYFVESFSSAFRSAASGYERMVDGPPSERKEPRELFDDALTEAFRAEYGVSPADLVVGLAAVFDLAFARSTAIVQTTKGELEEVLTAEGRLSTDAARAFIDTLSLPERPSWTYTPDGYLDRDWWPWCFRRRLALTVRPIVLLGSETDSPAFLNVGQLGIGISYLIDGIRTARFPQDKFFASEKMRSYAGAMANSLGHEFTAQVGTQLRELGWTVEEEVDMARFNPPDELGDLGDLDIVAWRTDDKRLILGECKRLAPAKTVREIVGQLAEFRGDSKDRLAKHVRRASWIAENVDRLRNALSVPDTVTELATCIITNVDVPMRFLTDLPLSPDQFVPSESIPTTFSGGAPSGSATSE